MQPLKGKIAVVAGATRGAGRGIAVKLGEAGATVYVTGRSVRGSLSDMGRAETIEETAALLLPLAESALPFGLITPWSWMFVHCSIKSYRSRGAVSIF